MLKILIILLFVISFMVPSVFADDLVIDRKIIDSTTVTDDGTTLGLGAGDRFGYYTEPIGDLDGNGVIDLAVSSYRDSNPAQHDDEGSVIIMFMNSDGTVKKSNKILHDGTSDGLGSSCITTPDNVDDDVSGFESIAYLGNLINGNPTLALGAPWDNHSTTLNGSLHNTGAIYLLELNSGGKVNSCTKIIPNGFTGTKFNPTTVFTGGDGIQTGFALIATDLNGDGQNELLTNIQATTNVYYLWAFYLDNTGTITKADEFDSSLIGVTTFFDTGRTLNGGNKIVLGKESTDTIYILNFIGNTGVLSSLNTIHSSSLGLNSGDALGSGVTPIGDIDGDGVIDLLVGAIFTDDNGNGGGNDEGAAYILFMNGDDTVKEYQKISNTSEKERTDSTFLQSDDFFGNGVAFWMNSGGQTVVAIGAHQADTGASNTGELYLFYLTPYTFSSSDSVKKKSGGSTINPPPTLGIGVNANEKRIVENGFSYNNNPINAERYWTDYPLITTQVGKTNTLELIISDNGGINNIKWVQVFLGVEEVGNPNSLAEVNAQLILQNTEFEELNVLDPQNLIENFRVVLIEPTKCKASSNDKSCLKVVFEYEYREAPQYNIIAINLMDRQRSSWTFFFNDGVNVTGDSLNEAPTDYFYHKSGNQHPTIKYNLIRTDKVNNIWTDQNGIEYHKNNYDTYDRITPMPEGECTDKPLDQIKSGGDRDNCHWREQLPHIWQY